MSLEHLWNGWRSEYVTGGVGQSSDPTKSVFIRILESGLTDEEAFIVHRSHTSFAILNAYPYATGHLLVLPYREIPHLYDLSEEETVDLWSVVKDATRALQASHNPDALNVGINLGAAAGGSIARHLHVHVVPRWNGDSNFMTAVASTRTLPESLPLTAEKIRNAWPKEAV
ncbi:MAG: HIT family protein [Ilumatobacteraceae bacterium]